MRPATSVLLTRAVCLCLPSPRRTGRTPVPTSTSSMGGFPVFCARAKGKARYYNQLELHVESVKVRSNGSHVRFAARGANLRRHRTDLSAREGHRPGRARSPAGREGCFPDCRQMAAAAPTAPAASSAATKRTGGPRQAACRRVSRRGRRPRCRVARRQAAHPCGTAQAAGAE